MLVILLSGKSRGPTFMFFPEDRLELLFQQIWIILDDDLRLPHLYQQSLVCFLLLTLYLLKSEPNL